MQPKQVTYLLSPILSQLWLFPAQGLPVVKALEGLLTDECPICTWTHVDVLHPTKPLGEEFPSLGTCRTTSFPSLSARLTNILWSLLVLTVSSENFPFSRFPEITPGTACLHFLLIWGEIVTRNFSHLFLVRWSFLSKKLTHAKIMQGTLLLHIVLKEFKYTNSSSWDSFANCGAAWILQTGTLGVTHTCKSRKKLTEQIWWDVLLTFLPC